MSLDDHRKFNRLKELLLAAMRSGIYFFLGYIEVIMRNILEDEPLYCIQRIIQSDFDDKQMLE
jgi:hypothetical protein